MMLGHARLFARVFAQHATQHVRSIITITEHHPALLHKVIQQPTSLIGLAGLPSLAAASALSRPVFSPSLSSQHTLPWPGVMRVLSSSAILSASEEHIQQGPSAHSGGAQYTRQQRASTQEGKHRDSLLFLVRVVVYLWVMGV